MIPIETTDKRELFVSYTVGFPYGDVVLKITQLDLLRIIKALERINNKEMVFILKKYIRTIDSKENEQTNFKRELPRRRLD